MNKTDLINAVAEKSGLTKADSKKAVDATIEAVIDALKAKEKIQLIGFGTFSVETRKERDGINPATKEKITIKAKNVAKFAPGAEVKNAINAK